MRFCLSMGLPSGFPASSLRSASAAASRGTNGVGRRRPSGEFVLQSAESLRLSVSAAGQISGPREKMHGGQAVVTRCPLENLKRLERRLDATYSAACCSYNAGVTNLLLRVPNAAGAVGCDGRVERALAETTQKAEEAFGETRRGEESAVLSAKQTQQEGTPRVEAVSFVDIFGRVQSAPSKTAFKTGSVKRRGAL